MIDSGLVFTAENGAALDPESVSRDWRQAVKKSLLAQIRLHDLRHTHATLVLQEEAASLIAGLAFAGAPQPESAA